MGMEKNPNPGVGRLGRVTSSRTAPHSNPAIRSNGKHNEANMVTGGKTVYTADKLPVAKSALGTFGK